jgi:redox-sensitive bicupin YhaK (pirin superfamily)
MNYNKINHLGKSDFVNMGPIRLRQPLPNMGLEMVDPFILLHHYGPYEISPTDNPFDLGPHPHRGFEPVTFLFQGEQLHRDSLGNESIVKAGDVQWTTAGRGIIHSERPTDELVANGGVIEGIQLWLNLPANKKMIPANYQHAKHQDFQTIFFDDKKVRVNVVAGNLNQVKGLISTQTSVNAYMIKIDAGGIFEFNIEANHQSLLYLIKGEAIVNDTASLTLNEMQLVTFESIGEGVKVEAEKDSQFLFLSGEPFNEEVTSWGPYVMNTQTEIMEAMRDYQMGKMGYLAR